MVKFFVTFGNERTGKRKSRYSYTSRAFGVCVCDNSTKQIKKYTYAYVSKIVCDFGIHHTNILFHEDCPGIFEFFFSQAKVPEKYGSQEKIQK